MSREPRSAEGHCASGHTLESGKEYCGEKDCTDNVWGMMQRKKRFDAPYVQELENIKPPSRNESLDEFAAPTKEEEPEPSPEKWPLAEVPKQTSLTCICWYIDSGMNI